MRRIIEPQWLKKNRNVKRSKAHELRLATELGGKRELRSGANKFSPWGSRTMGRDISTDKFLIEHKNTQKESISIKKEWLLGIKASAHAAMKDPMLIFTFQTGTQPPEDWAAIPLTVLKRLLASADTENP